MEFGSSIIKQLETTEIPFAILIICRPGRSVSPVVQSAPGMFQIYFGCEEVQNSFQAHQADASTFRRFWETMLKEGYFLPPSQFESNFVSTCHDDTVISETLEALGRAII